MNRRGQAFIEALLLLSIVSIAASLLIRIGLHLQNEILIDEVTESTLICILRKRSDCIKNMKAKFQEMNFRLIEIQDKSRPGNSRLLLHLTSRLEMSTVLESELQLDLAVD